MLGSLSHSYTQDILLLLDGAGENKAKSCSDQVVSGMLFSAPWLFDASSSNNRSRLPHCTGLSSSTIVGKVDGSPTLANRVDGTERML